MRMQGLSLAYAPDTEKRTHPSGRKGRAGKPAAEAEVVADIAQQMQEPVLELPAAEPQHAGRLLTSNGDVLHNFG